MSLSEQEKFLMHSGQFIGVIESDAQKKILYSINSKFYEVIYLLKKNLISSVERCDLDHAVKFYTHDIDLSDIM